MLLQHVFLMIQNWVKWQMCQRAVLPSRRTLTGWGNGLTEVQQGEVKSPAAGEKQSQASAPAEGSQMGAALQQRAWGPWWTLSWTWASNDAGALGIPNILGDVQKLPGPPVVDVPTGAGVGQTARRSCQLQSFWSEKLNYFMCLGMGSYTRSA